MRWPIVAAALTTLACAGSVGRPVPVSGPSAEIAALAGDWAGQYESEETGRSGTLVFRLPAGSDTARGDVMMIPRSPVMLQGRPEERQVPRPPMLPVLTINFVRAGHGTVTGVLDPYVDPDCDCTAYTTFSGTIAGDRIEGTYATRTSQSARYTHGRWSATRTR